MVPKAPDVVIMMPHAVGDDHSYEAELWIARKQVTSSPGDVIS